MYYFLLFLLHVALAHPSPKEVRPDLLDKIRGSAVSIDHPLDKSLNTRQSASAYTINTCPDTSAGIPAQGTSFLYSSCTAQETGNPASYDIVCQTPGGGGQTFFGRSACPEGYICVPQTPLIATCAVINNPQLVAQATAPRQVEHEALVMETPGQANAEVVLFAQYDQTLLFNATTITLSASDAYGNSLTDTVSCADCGVLGLGNIPSNAMYLEADVTLENVGDVTQISGYTWA